MAASPKVTGPVAVNWPILLKALPPESPGDTVPPPELLLCAMIAATCEVKLLPLARVALASTATLPLSEPLTTTLPACTSVTPV